jgi:hypothetical protein
MTTRSSSNVDLLRRVPEVRTALTGEVDREVRDGHGPNGGPLRGKAHCDDWRSGGYVGAHDGHLQSSALL